ncbi:MAG: efflux RND transporter permease subunit, partial [Spirochaetes bacterium]|nr:efflux RND transporter permease subunit [Spirochaetota bacterium]
LVVFYLNFRTIRGMLLPMATLIITDIWIMGLMGHLGVNITVVGTSLPALMVSVGSSYSIHILNQYYIDLSSILSLGKKKGLTLTMSHIAITVLLAGFTTFVGFASLATNQVTGIRDWGIFSAIGVAFAVFISTTMIPAMLMMLPHKQPIAIKKHSNGGTEIVKNWLAPFILLVMKLAVNHYKRVLAVLGIIIAVALAGAFQMKVDTNFLSYFKESDYVRQSVLRIGHRYGGTSGFSILIDSGEVDGIKEPKFLQAIDEFRSWLTSPQNSDLCISRTDAFTDVVKTMHMAMNNDDRSYWRIPDKKTEIVDYLEIYGGDDDNFDGRYDDFEPYLDQQYRTALIFAKIHHPRGELIAASDIKRIQAKIDEHLKNNLPKPYSYRITGEPAVMVRMADYQISGQMSSLALSLVVVFLIVVGLFKSWKAGCVALIPMSTAVILNFGIMGWTGIALDAATSIIAAVTIGIGIDDTIHFLNTYRHFRKKGFGVDETIKKTLGIAGTAIIYTSLALIFGFSVLTVSNFIPLIYTGLLIANTMIATTIGALLLLPSAIMLIGGRLDSSQSDSLFWKIFYIGRFFDFNDVNEKGEN